MSNANVTINVFSPRPGTPGRTAGGGLMKATSSRGDGMDAEGQNGMDAEGQSCQPIVTSPACGRGRGLSRGRGHDVSEGPMSGGVIRGLTPPARRQRCVPGVFLTLSLALLALPPGATAQDKPAPPETVREVYVPFDDLSILLESGPQRVYLTRQEYAELLAKAKLTKPADKAPQGAVILSAETTAAIENQRARLTTVLEIEVLQDGLQALPLELAGVGVRSAVWDQDHRPAAVGLNDKGQPMLFVEGRGRQRLTLELVTPLQTSAAQQTLNFQLPAPAAARLQLSVPGNVEIKSGSQVIRRVIDEAAGVTRFTLLPPRGPTTLVLSLNNKTLQQQRVVIARSVIVDEVTSAYERLHATVSFEVLHGATDRFRFALPDGFEPTEVLSPLVARWLVEKAADRRVLDVRLREPTQGKVVVNLSATRTQIDAAATQARLAAWQMPQLVPQDVAGQVAVVGLIVEDRLKAESLAYQSLIPIDNAVLTTALPDTVFRAEPGAPHVVPVAAYYAPQADYRLAATFRTPEERLKVTTNLLLVLNEKEQRVHGGFVLAPEAGKCFDARFSVPAAWQVTKVTALDGTALTMERYDDPQHGSRIQVRLPKGLAPGETGSILFEAVSIPEHWLGEWDQRAVAFPNFAVDKADSDEGAVAVRAEDDFVVRPDVLDQLTPLDENEKEKYGLKGVASNLAYRYDAQPYRATLTVQRTTPAITARCFSFLRLEPEGLTAHYEIQYHIQQARARRLSLLLPAKTPHALGLVGLAGATVKEFSSQDVAGGRRWTALLAEAAVGDVRLAVDFQQPLEDRDLEGFALPVVRAEDVAYQSAVVAVEGSADLDLDVRTDARKIDVGELVAAQYRVGRRLLGSYGFVGAPKDVKVDIHRRPGHALPPALVQRAELLTAVSASGRSQTAARYQLRTKALFLEVRLPPESTLWSALLDGEPVAPQRDGDRLLLNLPASGRNATRDLQVVYETPISAVHLLGRLRATAPELSLRADRGAAAIEVPTADLVWHLVLPPGHRLVRSNGTVFTAEVPRHHSPLWSVAAAMYEASGGVGEAGVAELLVGRHIQQRFAHVAATATKPSPYYLGDNVEYGGIARQRDGEELSELTRDSLAANAPDQAPATGEKYYDDNAVFRAAGGGSANAPAPGGMGGMGGGMGGGGAGFGGRGRPQRGTVASADGRRLPAGGVAAGSSGLRARLASPPAARVPSAPTSAPEMAPAAEEAAPADVGRQPSAPVAAPEMPARPGLVASGGMPGAAPGQPPLPPGGAGIGSGAAGTGLGVNGPGVGPQPTTAVPPLPPPPPGRDKFWALEGVRSLPIALAASGDQVTFQSLGVQPLLQVLLANERQLGFLAWGVGLVVFVIGLLLTRSPLRTRAKYVIGVALAALVLPLVTGLVHELGDSFDAAFYAACCLALYYLLAALIQWLGNCCCRGGCRSAAAQTGLVLLLVTLGAVTSVAAEPAAAAAIDPATLAELLEASRPIKLPEDAVVIPYDADAGLEGVKNAEKVLVPYAKYAELWNRAFPDKKLDVKPPVVPYSLAGAAFRATLSSDEFLLLQGYLDLDVFSDQDIQVPLQLAGGVLAAATVDGKPARLQFIQTASAPQGQAPAQQPAAQAANAPAQVINPAPAPDAAFALLHLSGRGRQRLELTIRLALERRGGWRVVAGRVPVAPAAALVLTVPAARTEVRLTGLADRDNYETTADNEKIETALPASGAFQLQWRPKVAEGQVDRSLTVDSQAVLDVQEDGLRLVWRLGLEFPRSRRDAFTIWIPADYLVEKVAGDNVRSWEVKPAEKRQRLEITLLKEAADREAVTVHLSRHGAIAPDGPTPFEAPVVTVDGAVLQKGRLIVRRSPLLELRTGTIEGLSRTDIPAEPADKAEAVESPLGLRPFQAYEFGATSFKLPLTAAPVASAATATIQSLLKIAERETTLETRVTVEVRQRPVHRVRIQIPSTLKTNRVTAPGDPSWAVTEEQGKRLLTVYLAAGQQQPFSVLIVGSLGRRQANDPVAAPRVDVLDMVRQQGDLVVQVDPAFEVRATGLQGCETLLLDQVFSWLQAEQRALARLAIRTHSADYQAKFEVTTRRPRVSGSTITNVKVTDVAVEETIIVDLTIHEAGIREVSFLLPARLAQARFNAPMLRQKTDTDEPGKPGWKRFRLELQDQIIGQYRILVENDRLLQSVKQDESELQEAPIPVLKSIRTEPRHGAARGREQPAAADSEDDIRTDQRYVTLENAGSDEVLAVDQQGLQPLGRQQVEWRKLAAILGEGITTAYLVKGETAEPRLTFKTKQRQTVQTAGAQIGLAETLLVVDPHGAYRGQQTYHVNNTTEQFLVVELPAGAELWTALVAGEPVKPTAVPAVRQEPRPPEESSPDTAARQASQASQATAAEQVRIPLIKTAEGDRDYPVVLKYGGQLSSLALLGQVAFPLIHTKNINVELSRVRLRLPETQRWWYFGGTMRQAADVGDFEAEYQRYNLKQVGRLMQVWDNANPYARARVANNLKQLSLAVTTYQSKLGDYPANESLRKNMEANLTAVQQAQQKTQQYYAQEQQTIVVDNRGRLNEFYNAQGNGLARNVVQGLGTNFDVMVAEESKAQSGKQSFDSRWLDSNQLKNSVVNAEQAKSSRYAEKAPQQNRGGKGGKVQDVEQRQSLAKGIADQQKPAKGQSLDVSNKSDAQPAQQRSQQQLAKQYQQELEAQTEQQGQQMQMQLDMAKDLPQQNGQQEGLAQVPQLVQQAPGGQPSTRSHAAGFDPFGLQPKEGTVNVWNVPGTPAASTPTVPVASWISLDVDLPERGQEYLFTTPRGDIAITAQTVSTSLVERLLRLLSLAAVILGLLLAYRLARFVGPRLLGSVAGNVCLLLVGVLSMLIGVFPVAGLLLLVIGVGQLVLRRVRQRQPVATGEQGALALTSWHIICIAFVPRRRGRWAGRRGLRHEEPGR